MSRRLATKPPQKTARTAPRSLRCPEFQPVGANFASVSLGGVMVRKGETEPLFRSVYLVVEAFLTAGLDADFGVAFGAGVDEAVSARAWSIIW
jgi:hypothetical protein